MQFVPPFEEIAVCAFHFFAAVERKNGVTTIGAAVAKNAGSVPDAIFRALVGFPTPEQVQKSHLDVVASCCVAFSDAASWIMSDVSGLPANATVELFDDKEARITVAMSPIIDLTTDGQNIDHTLTGMNATIGEALLNGLLSRAEAEYVVPFAGTADPDTWAAIVDAILGGDRNSLVRLAPRGMFNELGSNYEPATTDADTTIEAEICFVAIPGSDAENEIIRLCDVCEEVNIRRLSGNNTVIRVTASKGEVMRILDFSDEAFTAVKLFKTDRA